MQKKLTILVPLRGGQFAYIDPEDAENILQYPWHITTGYATRSRRASDGPGPKTIMMHREVLGDIPEGKEVDHINRNKLDNRRSNLRIATKVENCGNAPKRRNNKSGFIGVSWFALTQKWRAQIIHNHKNISLGLHDSAEAAARAYDDAARKYRGEFANLNFPDHN